LEFFKWFCIIFKIHRRDIRQVKIKLANGLRMYIDSHD